MSKRAQYRFDLSALYAALNEARVERGSSWRQVADEIGVAPSTIRRTSAGGRMEADGVRAMVAWLGRSPEDFVVADAGLTVPEARRRGPQTSGRPRRFNTSGLFEALDHRRRSMGLSWREVAVQLGGPVTAAMLERLRTGGRIEVNLMVSATGWLGISVEDLTHETDS